MDKIARCVCLSPRNVSHTLCVEPNGDVVLINKDNHVSEELCFSIVFITDLKLNFVKVISTKLNMGNEKHYVLNPVPFNSDRLLSILIRFYVHIQVCDRIVR